MVHVWTTPRGAHAALCALALLLATSAFAFTIPPPALATVEDRVANHSSVARGADSTFDHVRSFLVESKSLVTTSDRD